MRGTWTIDADSAGMRLDKYLAAAGRLDSRGRAAAALERGKVFLNDREVGPADRGVRLSMGDRVRVWTDRPGSASRRHAAPSGREGASAGALEILFEDRTLLVVNKPAGVLTVPLPRKPHEDSVYAQVLAYLRSRRRTPHVVHRIDRDTSGLVVFAKDARTQQTLKAQFIRREPERVYLAVVTGHPSPAEGTWRDHLAWDHSSLVQQETDGGDPRGVEALCRYRLVEPLTGASLIEVRLHTGKRNQIRIQAALRGHPLVGERQYVGLAATAPRDRRAYPFHRQALHAWRLGFEHPAEGRPLGFEAPIPHDIARLLEALRRPAAHGT
jgi:23S rRNA pseudouridine1911/1915/1917 synthase